MGMAQTEMAKAMKASGAKKRMVMWFGGRYCGGDAVCMSNCVPQERRQSIAFVKKEDRNRIEEDKSEGKRTASGHNTRLAGSRI